ncbi:hypothetical protein SAY87_026133 [Trapa incisa]|uniref:Protein kinase domain-containing protein n=1 Tax=Trapa incisa TaxID=236973 RepID=A0AAN7JCU1_9MYRT|nr:hypothetical protein SAY87_026133 [Trapa incisa]
MTLIPPPSSVLFLSVKVISLLYIAEISHLLRPLVVVIQLLVCLYLFHFGRCNSSVTLQPLERGGGSRKEFSTCLFLYFFSVISVKLKVSAEEHQGMNSGSKLIVALVVACSSLGAIMFFSLCFWIYHFRCKHRARTDASSFSASCFEPEKGFYLTPISSKFGSLKVVSKKASVSFIDYKILEKATDNFNPTRKLGEGGFGCVYEGTLEDSTPVAVKKLDCGNKDVSGDFEVLLIRMIHFYVPPSLPFWDLLCHLTVFWAFCHKILQIEVKILSKMQHPNIISLLGYSTNCEAQFIVYELMQNGSLDTKLHGPSPRSTLTWHMRMKIALDIARGLEYLHGQCQPPVIHRDLKSANILLDSNFNAKLSDFGLAVTKGRRKKDKSDLSGTLGYVAPEYLLDGELTEKSDVYAFGVVLLELLLGRRPMEKLAPGQCQSIVNWALPQLTDRSKLPDILDPFIEEKVDMKHLYQVAAVALLCLQPEPSYRPLIADVLHSLVPLVPITLGGTLHVEETLSSDHQQNS